MRQMTYGHCVSMAIKFTLLQTMVMYLHMAGDNSVAKTFLYEKESRGSRHLIYDSEKPLLHFLECNRDIKEMLVTRDEWTVWYAPYCFKSSDEITHGGAHFLELAIPFVRIDKE
jgi:hypothetical protein